MEKSPLTLQVRPRSFQPKITQLYDALLVQEDEDVTVTDGYWQEFFLLKPDKSVLREKLEGLSSTDLLHLQHETQQLFRRALRHIEEGNHPSNEHALDTLSVFLTAILAKKFTNPSADVITVITGLDEVDAVFSDFASAIERCIKSTPPSGTPQRAIDVALSLTAGASQTSLVSYFSYRDLFPALTKSIQDSEDNSLISKALLLLGLLANYNKFEHKNTYRVRLEDFVNESAIQQMVRCFGAAFASSRNQYVMIQEDMAEGWNLSSALAYVGLGLIAPSKTKVDLKKAENFTADFAELPDASAACLLSTFEFMVANKIFCHTFISSNDAKANSIETPFSSFLSLTSYILHHVHRSGRATTYGLLNLLILRVIIEDLVLCRTLCDSERLLPVRLCRQRRPQLPATPRPRPAGAAILDLLVDTINHNLRRNLDVTLYIFVVDILHRLLSCLVFTRTKLDYHWSLLWQTLLSFIRFLTNYAPSLPVQDPDLSLLIRPLVATLALAAVSGDSFFPNAIVYDDLFYKLVESGEYLERFRKAFLHCMTPSDEPGSQKTTAPGGRNSSMMPIDLLLQISHHYRDLVDDQTGKGRVGKNLSPREVSKVIRQGYETLSLPHMEGLDKWYHFKESDHRGLLKRAARTAVEDTKRLLKASN